MQLTSTSFAHPSVPGQRRAELWLSNDALVSAQQRLRDAGLEAFLLSTCLRVEVVVAGGPAQSAAVMAAVYGDAGLADAATVRTEEEAFWYLCRLAAGLESPIVGEREIFAQFRQAVATFEEWTTGQALSRALQRAVGVARSVRRSLPSTDGSLASLAVHHAAAFDQVAVLGSGAMARAAASALGPNVTMFARRPESVAGVAIRPWSEVADALNGFPALIAAIPGTADATGLADARQIVRRRAAPLLVVDLGMPPALAEVAGLPTVRYVGIDDLAASSQEQPPPAVVASARMEAARAWKQLAAAERVGSVIAGLIDQADAAVKDEVQRFAHRIAAADDPEPVLHQMAHTVARRILHRPISYLSSSEHEQAVEILEQAFGVER